MRYKCPSCSTMTKSDEARKYIPGQAREHYSTAHVLLRRRKCNGRKGCGHEFILRIEYPLDSVLEPKITASYNWAEFNNALKVKPGLPIGGTTHSEHTLQIGQDVASVWWLVLGYDKPPVINRKALSYG